MLTHLLKWYVTGLLICKDIMMSPNSNYKYVIMKFSNRSITYVMLSLVPDQMINTPQVNMCALTPDMTPHRPGSILKVVRPTIFTECCLREGHQASKYLGYKKIMVRPKNLVRPWLRQPEQFRRHATSIALALIH